MRRAALVSAAFVTATALLLAVRGVGGIARAPLITYGGLTGALVNYDVGLDRSAPLIHGIDKLPVAWSWSPDGTRLAYVLLDYPSGAYEIMLWSPELRRASVVASNLPFGSPPQWSPDSRTIADISMNQDICLYSVAGDPPRCLNVQPAGQPVWSPDGASLAYLSRIPEGGLLRVDAADGTVTPLFTGVNGISWPRWSPDGTLVVFSYQAQQAGVRHLYVVPAGGGTARALTGGETLSQDLPAWSPDGRYIAYREHPDGNPNQSDIAVLDMQTGEAAHVTRHPMTDTDPRWSPDGRWLAFVSDRAPDQRPRLYVVPFHALHTAEPLAVSGVQMRLYAYAWRP